jgi:hypothetical protein
MKQKWLIEDQLAIDRTSIVSSCNFSTGIDLGIAVFLMLRARTSHPHYAGGVLHASDQLIPTRVALTADGASALPERGSFDFNGDLLPRFPPGSIFGMAALGFNDSSPEGGLN